MRIYRNTKQPDRTGLTWEQTWQGEDRGLIRSWEIGRRDALRNPDLAARCKAGELPPLGWKGGGLKTLKKLTRWGSLHYLAEWQALRGEPLHIDLNEEPTIICSRTGMIVTFTGDHSKLAGQGNDTDDEGATHGSAPRVSEQSLFPSGTD